MKPKGAVMKGKGNPARETPAYVEPDQYGNRAARRRWARLRGRSVGTTDTSVRIVDEEDS